MGNIQSKSAINKYNDSIVYLISSIHTNDVYVGSTTQDINTRMKQHLNAYNQFVIYQSENNYCYSFDILKHGDCEITLLENVNANTNEELRIREDYYYDTLDNVVNKNKPYSTDEEKKEQKRNHYFKNIDKYKEYNKNYNIENKDKIKQYREENKEHIAETNKIYYNKNKEHIKESHNEWKAKNKEHIALYKKQKNSVKILCPCSGQYTADHKSKHLNTKKHLKYIQSLDNNKK